MDIWNNDNEVEDAPVWCRGITYADCRAVVEGGCASGAWMPAVTYYQARNTMNEWGDAVLEYLEGVGLTGDLNFDGVSWSGIAVHFLSMAVEIFALEVVDNYDEDDEELTDVHA